MTVKELADYLAALANEGHADALVVMSRDSEGNGFSPFCGDHSEGRYIPDSTYSGDFYSARDFEDDHDLDPEGGQAAVVLWPIN